MACKSYHVSRRRFVQSTAAGLAAMLGMNVRDLSALAGTGAAATADHVVLLWMAGGMSHIDTFDPKPGRPTAGEFKPIKTTASGIEVSEILPNIAQQMKHAALIRSVAGRIGDHDLATYKLTTGYTKTPQLVHPGFGSIVAHELEQQGDLPSFVAINGRTASAGYLGQRYEAYYIGNPGEPDPHLSLPEGITHERASRRMDLLTRANSRFAQHREHSQFGEIDRSYQAANRLLRSPALKAFDLEQEPEGVRAAYGATSFGRGCLLARRLVDHGVRFVQVNMGGFDTHQNNFPAMRTLGSVIDAPIGALIGDLAASGKLDRTLVVMLSEFGRTPRINGDAGRDHHPRVFSSLMAGGGVKAGALLGSSDADGYDPDDRPVPVNDLHATVCRVLGIDPNKKVNTPLGRPMKLLEHGAPIPELLRG